MQARRQRPYLTPHEVAELLMVSPVTVRQWAQKGLIQAETTVGGHRRFLRREVERFARERSLTIRQPDDGTLRVLIVDDDHQFGKFLKEALTGLSAPVVAEIAVDGFDAGRKLHQFQPEVVLLDLMMPGLDGFEVCRRMRSDPTTKGVRTIALTGYYTEDHAERILNAGAEFCLAKPVELDVLLNAMGLPLRAED